MDSIEMIIKHLGIKGENITYDAFNADYEGFDVSVSGNHFKSRRAHKTPTKQGYFLAMWIKDEMNKNCPYEYDTFPPYLVVSIIDEGNKGLFLFSKKDLLKHGILKSKVSKGKMAFRVYTPWDTQLNRTAEKTKQWQIKSFFNLNSQEDFSELKHRVFIHQL